MMKRILALLTVLVLLTVCSAAVAAARGETLMKCIIVNPGESFVKENGKWQDWTEAKKDLPPDGDSAEEDLWDYDNFGIKAFFRENF